MPTEPLEMYETFKSLADAGAFLRARRRAAGLSQPKVASRMGVHPSTLSRLESGKVKRHAERLLKAYAKALKLCFEVSYAVYPR